MLLSKIVVIQFVGRFCVKCRIHQKNQRGSRKRRLKCILLKFDNRDTNLKLNIRKKNTFLSIYINNLIFIKENIQQ